MKRLIKPTLLLVSMIVFILTGCASYMHGYTERKAMDRYLLVNEATESFGYKRMQYNMGYNRSLKGFIEEHGLPDFIFEYKNKKDRGGIKMFYAEKDIVYVYESHSWVANSLYLKKHRPLTDYEKATYEEIK
jgi:lipopolysaccharide export LptBFGC system permease protein LptF